MISTLIFLLGPDPGTPIVWGRIEGGRVAAHGRLADAMALQDVSPPGDASVTVAAVLQGEDVAARVLAAPSRGESKLLAAARYLLEDELAESMEGLHVAVAPSSAGARIAALRNDIVESWLAAFQNAGIELDLLLVDFLALPSSQEGGTLILRDGRAVAAFDGVGFAAEVALVCGDRAQEFFGPDRRFAVLGQAAEIKALPFRTRTESAGAADDETLLLLYARAAEDPARLNLRQGRHRRRTPWRAVAAPWRRAAVLALCAGSAALFAILSDGAREDRAADKWSKAAKTLHAQSFPDVPAAEAVAHARKRLAQGSARTFSRVTAVVGKAAEAGDTVEVARVRYDAADAQYFVSVRSVTDADIEAFKNRLIAGGITAADNGGYRRIGEVWAGELVVRVQ